MPTHLSPAKAPAFALNDASRRRKRLIAIVANGLPPFEHTVTELNSILNNPGKDIKHAAKPIRTDPSLSAQILRMCNSPLFGRRSRVISIEQATILLGADRLHSLALTSSLVGFAGKGLPAEQVGEFWKHGFFAAMLSKHLAKYTGYTETEQAYIAGLLHDIGQVPQWMLTVEEAQTGRDSSDDWFDNPAAQRKYFGIDHCELGSFMVKSWDMKPSFVDVVLKHHEPEEAQHDPELVKIVAGVEHFLLTREERGGAAGENGKAQEEPRPAGSPKTTRTRSCFAQAEWEIIAKRLEDEYERLLPLVEETLTHILAASN